MLTTFSGRRASQNEYELTAFLDFLRDHNVKTYAEVGAREGDTFHDVVEVLGGSVYALAIDYPGALWGKSTTAVQLERCVQDLRARGYDVEHILGDSKSDAVINFVETRAPFDAILIDGDHTYAGVKADWENYRGLARIVAFHDIVGDGQREKVTNRAVEVPRLWAEIKETGLYETHEFVDEGSAMGIGVAVMPA